MATCGNGTCKPQCGCDRPCDCKGHGIVTEFAGQCIKRSQPEPSVKLATIVYQPQMGTDAEGQPNAPKYGAHTNTVVLYQANGAVYIYDAKGQYTPLNNDAQQSTALEALQEALAVETANRTQADEWLQENINQLANKETEDVTNLQTNINTEVERATKAEETLSKGLNDENKRAYEAEQVIKQNVEAIGDILAEKQDTLVSGTNIKTINGESILGEGDIEITGGEGGSGAAPTANYTADNVNLVYPSDTVELTPAVGSADGKVSQAGIMSAFQASQLEALAAAYEAEEKGTVLYEGSASVNNIELSESGLSYDHLIIVAQYMGMGSFALEQQVSEVFYPTDSVKAFQMNATDITTGNTPMVQLIQDIWSITDDGMEIELASSLKATVNSETTVEPDTTSNFTITKVVGFGKKLAEA